MPNHTSSMNPPTTATEPTKPSSSAITAKMKSLWASGRYPSLARRPPMPDPVSPPSAMPSSPCYVCYARCSLLPSMSRKAVNRSKRRGSDTNASSAPMPPTVASEPTWNERHAGDDADRQDRGAEHDRRAEVALGEAHAAADRGDERQRHDAAPRLVQLVLVAREVVGRAGDRRQLEELRRLEAERAEPHPRPGVVDRRRRRRARTAASCRRRPARRRGWRAPATAGTAPPWRPACRAGRARPTSACRLKIWYGESAAARPGWPTWPTAPSPGRASRTRRRRR